MKRVFKWIVIVLVVLFIIGLIVGNDGAETTTAQTATSSGAEPVAETVVATPVTASELFAAYESNEVAADKQYKDQLLEVSGKVASIDSGLGDSANVSLATSNQFLSVTAKGDDAFNDAAATLSKGQDIKVVCKGDGEVIGMPMLKDCVIQ